MAYLALYRKYRPLTFGEVIGQEFVTTALRHAVAGDRLAHAYLFSGPRGTGKTSTARIFARAINCLAPQNGEPCNECANCKSILAGQWGLVEIDGASHNRVEDMRSLLDAVSHVPMSGKYNVYIIDEVHMLSNAAFNAFLKTLEEPPAHVKFILATTEAFKVPRTIHSRCQHYLFQTVPTGIIAGHVSSISKDEGLEIDAVSARLIGEAGNGSLRDALSVLDRVIAYCGTGAITGEAVQRLLGLGDIDLVLRLLQAASGETDEAFMTALEETVLKGADLAEVTKSLLEFGRVLLFLSAGIEDEALLGMPMTSEQRSASAALAKSIGRDRLYLVVESIAALQQQLKFDVDKRLGFELGLLQLRNRLSQPTASEAPRAVSEARDIAPRPAATPAPPASRPTEQRTPQPTVASASIASGDQFEALAAQLDRDKAGAAAPKPKIAPIPDVPREISIVPGQSDVWTAFLSALKPDHPAWVILLQGLVLQPDGEHRYLIDKPASRPIAVAWLQEQLQWTELHAAYHARIGQALSLGSVVREAEAASETPVVVEQPNLAGLTPPPGWQESTASTLKSIFPDATIHPE